MSEPRKYTVSLLGKEYVLVSDESQEHINEAASLVNDLMETISKNTDFTHEKISVLAALQLASEVVAERSKVSLCKEKTQSLVDFIDQSLYESPASSY